MKHSLVLVILALLAGFARAEPLTRSTETGLIRGVEQGGVAAFLGVPFAAPPVASLRWRESHPAAQWRGIRPAERFGNDCIQNGLKFPDAPATSEDCLYLNIWTARGAGARLPVMVYIFGGGFNIGSPSWPMLNGAVLARRGVVLVSLNYRLGKLGYFMHPALAAEHPHARIGNYGLLDLIDGLRWVKRNIASFGGDPTNLTIFGESTGGTAVEYLVASPNARGLFQRAIVQSSVGNLPLPSTDEALKAGSEAAASWGVTTLDAAHMRAVPAAAILGNATMTEGGAVPMIDDVLPTPPLTALRARTAARVPLLIGSNKFEAGFFASMSKDLSKRISPLWPKAEALYDGYGSHELRLTEGELLTDIMIAGPADEIARAASADGMPTYRYEYSYLRPKQRGQIPGPMHFDELYAVFGSMDHVALPTGALDDQASPDTQRVCDEVGSRWVAFARDGAPGDGWPALVAGRVPVLEFTDDGTEVQEDPGRARLDFAEALPATPPPPANRNRALMPMELDARGLKCPLPVLKARRALREVALNELMTVLVTDPGAPDDFVHFCATTGNELVATEVAADHVRIRIRRLR